MTQPQQHRHQRQPRTHPTTAATASAAAAAGARRIVHDLIVSISSTAGWTSQQTRMLIDSHGHTAVFTTPTGPPTHTFTIDGFTGRLNPRNIRGTTTLTTTNGDTITFRRKGASCSWKLAKCNQSTKRLTGRWPTHSDTNTSGGEHPDQHNPGSPS